MPDRVALITGASKGIGQAIALALAGREWELVLTARNEKLLAEVVQEIHDLGGSGRYQAANLTDQRQIENLVDVLANKNKKLDLLVHSAGVAYVGSGVDFPPERWLETLNVNLTAPFLLMQKCLPLMPSGSLIVFINSVAGKNMFADWSAYCASKAGLRAYADVLRQEVGGRGIRVTSIFPSTVNTTLHDRLPYDWNREHMLQVKDIACAVVYCTQQPASVVIKEIDLENSRGLF
jgi:NADP-dependent 3-hydroxy acid dehydrogenase YdfG